MWSMISPSLPSLSSTGLQASPDGPVHKAGLRARQGLAHPKAYALVLKAGHRATGQRRELVSRVRRIPLAPVIGHVAVQIVADRARSPLGQLIGRIVGGTDQRLCCGVELENRRRPKARLRLSQSRQLQDRHLLRLRWSQLISGPAHPRKKPDDSYREIHSRPLIFPISSAHAAGSSVTKKIGSILRCSMMSVMPSTVITTYFG
jgi:hypothetical protein